MTETDRNRVELKFILLTVLIYFSKLNMKKTVGRQFFLRSTYLSCKRVFLFDKSAIFRINVINVMRTISVVNLIKTLTFN